MNTATDLRGALWVDDQTGALLKAEFLQYEANDRQPVLEHAVEVSQVSNWLTIPGIFDT